MQNFKKQVLPEVFCYLFQCASKIKGEMEYCLLSQRHAFQHSIVFFIWVYDGKKEKKKLHCNEPHTAKHVCLTFLNQQSGQHRQLPELSISSVFTEGWAVKRINPTKQCWTLGHSWNAQPSQASKCQLSTVKLLILLRTVLLRNRQKTKATTMRCQFHQICCRNYSSDNKTVPTSLRQPNSSAHIQQCCQ